MDCVVVLAISLAPTLLAQPRLPALALALARALQITNNACCCANCAVVVGILVVRSLFGGACRKKCRYQSLWPAFCIRFLMLMTFTLTFASEPSPSLPACAQLYAYLYNFYMYIIM